MLDPFSALAGAAHPAVYIGICLAGAATMAAVGIHKLRKVVRRYQKARS